MSARLASAAHLLCFIQVAAAALLIAACGSASSTRSATAGDGQSAAKEPSAYTAAKAGHDLVTNGVVTHRPMHGTGGGEINDDNPADIGGHRATAASDPCKLVSRAEAQAIVGRPLDTPVEARLGPTCIYHAQGAKSFITMAVEPIELVKISGLMRDQRQLKVSGRTALCGTYGQPTTFVPVAGGRALVVTAPCAIGIQFAAKALPKMPQTGT